MPNPYLQDQAGQISRNLTDNWQQNLMPSINSGAIASGGFGGSRQGIAQGLGMGQTQRAIGDAQTNLYSNAYNTDQQLQAQKDMQAASLQQQQKLAEMQDATNRYGMGNSYNLALGGLGASLYQADQNFFTNQRGQDLSAMGLGANLTQSGNLGLTNQGSQLWNMGQQQQNAPWQSLGNLAGTLQPFSGMNQTNTNSTPGGSAFGGFAGGALTIAQLMQLLNGGGK